MKFLDAQQASVEMFTSPAFIARIREEDPSMLQQLGILQDINKAGLITLNSQAGRFQKGKHYKTGKNYEMSERAYIEGFMPQAAAEKFIKEMNIQTDKVAVFIPHSDGKLDIPASLDVPLTITKTEGEVKVNTHMSLALPTIVWESYRKQAKLSKMEKVAYLFCWDPKWTRLASGPHGLFTDVLRILRSI